MATTVPTEAASTALRLRPRFATRWMCGLVVLMALTGGATAGPDSVEEPLTSVTAWKPTMTLQDIGMVRIAYTPPMSSARQYTGANHQSDGQVLVVSLRSCLVNEECPTLQPAQARSAAGGQRWFEVAVPYQGERVVVEGDGPAKLELAFSR